jgi:cyclopropane-fatty-acyl-phospholipid synthase
MSAATLPIPLSWSLRLLERGLLPDGLVRFGIRRLLKVRLAEERQGGLEAQQRHLMELISRLRQSPIAVNTTEANLQHYELPCAFFEQVLGRHLKYSCGYYRDSADTLDDAEARMLQLTAERACLRDGDRILELGCGWGSLSLWMAARYPQSRITAVSNSRTQKLFIDARAAERGLGNLQVITCDVNRLSFPAAARFDRVVSVEMFEHVRNYERLMQRICGWLEPAGTLFVHLFAHERYAYPFEVRDESDWMAKYFFTGGIMPSDDLLLYFQNDLRIQEHWRVDGRHYSRTSEHWLQNMDRHRAAIEPILAQTYGADQVRRWWMYWRVFFMSCAELWGFAGGQEWLVSHYLFRKPGLQTAAH